VKVSVPTTTASTTSTTTVATTSNITTTAAGVLNANAAVSSKPIPSGSSLRMQQGVLPSRTSQIASSTTPSALTINHAVVGAPLSSQLHSPNDLSCKNVDATSNISKTISIELLQTESSNQFSSQSSTKIDVVESSSPSIEKTSVYAKDADSIEVVNDSFANINNDDDRRHSMASDRSSIDSNDDIREIQMRYARMFSNASSASFSIHQHGGVTGIPVSATSRSHDDVTTPAQSSVPDRHTFVDEPSFIVLVFYYILGILFLFKVIAIADHRHPWSMQTSRLCLYIVVKFIELTF
jgi:hypothetical protein